MIGGLSRSAKAAHANDDAYAFGDSIEPPRRPRRRWWLRILVAIVLAVAVLALLLTDSAPRIAATPPPTAEQVGAARAAAGQLNLGQQPPGPTTIRLGNEDLAAIGSLASNGFRPNRLRASAKGGIVNVAGSYRLPLGRWLNVALVSGGAGKGFPPIRLTVGSIAFPPGLSRAIVEGVRRAAIARGAKLAPLDRLVRGVTVKQGVVTATVRLPSRGGIMAALGDDTTRARAAAVRGAYCRLVTLQQAEPSNDFAAQVRRTFATDPPRVATAESNRVGFIALAMLIVDPRVGQLVGVDHAAIAACPTPPITTLLNDRADLPKHWALSAALAAATDTQFSQAMGEWKELADSISRQSQFAVGDPSGFSFLDLAADRSGFLTAGAAVDPVSAGGAAARLATAAQEDLLPPTLMRLEDGMSNAAFVEKYGSTSDPRFAAMLAAIDAELRRAAAERSRPPSPSKAE